MSIHNCLTFDLTHIKVGKSDALVLSYDYMIRNYSFILVECYDQEQLLLAVMLACSRIYKQLVVTRQLVS